jgi:amidase
VHERRSDMNDLQPAGRNNVVGLKPTLGRTSRHGVIPISLDADSVGPLARSVQDAALVMQAIAGKVPAFLHMRTAVLISACRLLGRDPHDKDSMRQPEVLPDFTSRLHKDSLRGARIGVLRRGFTDDIDFFKRHGWGDRHLYDEVITAYNDAVAIVRELGAEGSFRVSAAFVVSYRVAR